MLKNEMRDYDLTCPKCGAKDALRIRVVEVYDGIRPQQEVFQDSTILRWETEDMEDSSAQAVYCQACCFRIEGLGAVEQFFETLATTPAGA